MPGRGGIMSDENRYPAQRKVTAVGAVVNRIDYLSAIGAEALANTEKYISELQALLQSLEPPDISDIVVPGVSVPDVDYGGRPELGELNLPTNWPVKDFTLTLKPVTVVPGVIFPVFNITDPTYETVTKPTLVDPADPGAPPTVEAVEVPGAPPLVLPNLPPLSDITIPTPPHITISDFDADLIPWNVDDPGEFTWGPPAYQSDIWSDLLEKVLHNIKHGGTGLDFQVEEDIYWQHLNRTFHENEKLLQQAENMWAARGFTLPPGMLSAQINEANAQISRNNLQASRDITISQAELAQKNTHFFIEKGAQLEGMLREFFINEANLSLQGQRAVAEHSIAIYNAHVQRHNYYLEEYKTKAQVWETRVRAALVEVEIFKAEVEGAKVSAEVQKLLVDVYTAQLSGLKMLMDLYVAEMQGADIKVRVQESKMRVYGEVIKAFMARIEANRAKIQMYEAEMSGEMAKANLYKTQVDAYGARVNAKTQELQGQIAHLEAQIEENKASIGEYAANIQGYSAEVQARASEIGAKVSGFQALAAAYQAETGRDAAFYQTKLGEIQAKISEASFALQRGVAMVEAATQGYTAVKGLQVEGTSGIMNVGAQLAASAMNAINTSAGISYSGSDALNDQYSDSLSTNHNYYYNME